MAINPAYVEEQILRAVEMINRAEAEQARHLRNKAAYFDTYISVREVTSERAYYLVVAAKLYLDEALTEIKRAKGEVA